MTQSVGITAYGAYLPRLRLDRASIAKALGKTDIITIKAL